MRIFQQTFVFGIYFLHMNISLRKKWFQNISMHMPILEGIWEENVFNFECNYTLESPISKHLVE